MDIASTHVGLRDCRASPPGHDPTYAAARATDGCCAEAALSERRRIADELHDILGVRLVALALQARGLADHPDPEVRATSARLDHLAHQTMTDVRAVLGTLPASSTGERALRGAAPADALPCLTAHLSDLAGSFPTDRVRIAVTATEASRAVPTDVAHSAARVVAEGVVNAVKHGTGRVDVSVLLADTLCVEVGNATGPAREDVLLDSGGHGLPGMRRHVEEHGGVFHAGRSAHGRFHVRAVFALDGRDGVTGRMTPA